MKAFRTSFFHAARGALFALAASTGGVAMAQTATFDADCAPQLSGMQQRLFNKANEGPEMLRDFMFVRRGILQLDIYETGAWADSIREGRAACMKQLARVRPAPGTATRMAAAGVSAAAR